MSTRTLLGTVVAMTLVVLAVPLSASAQQTAADVNITYEKFILDNGLTLIVHEDRKAPIVAVNIWYHVGSKNENPGRTGFAHLFEHLMFNGSENADTDYFSVLDPIGATDLNGTTNNDRTNYFQNVPTSALDVALWMESDRMGHLIGAITQEKLDEQRGVVQNEKRQGENQPYGRVQYLIAENTYPVGHPYSWTVIGSMEDLSAAAVEDVHEWFTKSYGPANAVLAVAGDIDSQTALARVEHFFGHIPSGPPLEKHEVWIAKRSGSKREVMQDRVPQARIYKVWNIPQWGSEEGVFLSLVGDVLSSGKTSRLYKRLVYDDQIATSISASAYLREIAGQMTIVGTAGPGKGLAEVETAIDEELARFLDDGPTPEELARAKAQYRASFVRGVERIGGFGGKSDVLAMNQVYGGSPDYYKKSLEMVAGATADDLRQAARKWLSDGVYNLEVHPFPSYAQATEDADRSSVPEAGPPPAADFPGFQRTTLSNGLEVIVAERRAVPVVELNLMIDAGFAADQHGIPGTASMALQMLDEGTRGRTSLEISDELEMLGATLGAGSDLDMSFVSMSALAENLDASLDLFADVILNPAFPDGDFERVKALQMAAIQQEKADPFGMVLRMFPEFLYGEGHAYSLPFTGSGTEESLGRIQRGDLLEFHQSWFKPNNGTLVVVGATSVEEIRDKLEARLGSWESGNVPEKNLSTVQDRENSLIYLLDFPGSPQSVIFAGHLAPPQANPDEIAINTMNTILGGDFTSRINMNIREDKGWSYGAASIILPARGQRPFVAYAPVQSDKTAESVLEIRKELLGIQADHPATQEEVTNAKAMTILRLPGQWETNASVLTSLGEIVEYGYDDDYFGSYPDRIRAVGPEDVNRAARNTLKPDGMIWVIAGDRSVIEESLRALGLGDVVLIDRDGDVVGGG